MMVCRVIFCNEFISLTTFHPKESRFIEWEEGGTGLGVRVFPSGVKSFVFMCRFKGKARMMTVGKYPMVALVEARRKVALAGEHIEKGVDPGKKNLERGSANALYGISSNYLIPRTFPSTTSMFSA